jgi:hypothetical protein
MPKATAAAVEAVHQFLGNMLNVSSCKRRFSRCYRRLCAAHLRLSRLSLREMRRSSFTALPAPNTCKAGYAAARMPGWGRVTRSTSNEARRHASPLVIKASK